MANFAAIPVSVRYLVWTLSEREVLLILSLRARYFFAVMDTIGRGILSSHRIEISTLPSGTIADCRTHRQPHAI